MTPQGWETWSREKRRAWLDKQWAQLDMFIQTMIVVALVSPFAMLAGPALVTLFNYVRGWVG